MVRDNGNCKKLHDFLKKFSPFKETDSPDSVRNIVTGVHGSSKVNVDTAITVGSNILSDMLTKRVADYHFKTSLQAVNLVQKIRISDKEGSVSVNPKLLFQSLTAILLSGKNNDNQINLSDLFSYSLCAYPAPLAYSPSGMLVSAKSKLLEPFKETCSIKTNLTNDQQIGVVIDGVDLMYTMGETGRSKVIL